MSWKYDCLFESELEPEGEDLSRWWRPQPSIIPVGRMGYRRRVTLAGDRMECEIYPVFGREDEKRARAARKNITPTKQKRLNDERARRHLVLLADANFTDKDIHLTLTYRSETTLEQCRKVLSLILNAQRMRRANVSAQAAVDGLVQQILTYKDNTVAKINSLVQPVVYPGPEPGKIAGMGENGGSPTPAPKPQKLKTIYRQVEFPTRLLQSESDVDAYVAEVKKKLMKELSVYDGVRVN